jgi:DNA-binding MarR family transcriptional regulator
VAGEEFFMAYEQLKLENQLCFPLYAASRLVIQAYQPHLDRLGITYPQYLVLMILWETDHIAVNEITRRLILNTNTITPLLKRMETQGLISRQRSEKDERKVIITLTPQGRQLQTAAASIPASLVAGLVTADIQSEDLQRLKDQLYQIIHYLSHHEE